ncbi:GAF and ANTAR domain-containing protein [Mycobacterium yunnanensis]|nr:GAF and ANTAR domain-containing protein [Mycobacterium yunnanensis]
MREHGPDDLEPVLREVNESNVAFVPGARYAGITIMDSSGTVSTLGGTAPCARVLDDVQRDFGEGPCLSAAWQQHIIFVDDLTAEHRWPRFRDAALHRTPVRSTMSFRLVADDRQIATLNFYADTAGVFDDESIELGLLAATHTAVAWNMLQRDRQFRSALSSRDVIGQAKGMLMERYGIDAVAAFELLKQLSQQTNVKLTDVVARLVGDDRPS